MPASDSTDTPRSPELEAIATAAGCHSTVVLDPRRGQSGARPTAVGRVRAALAASRGSACCGVRMRRGVICGFVGLRIVIGARSLAPFPPPPCEDGADYPCREDDHQALVPQEFHNGMAIDPADQRDAESLDVWRDRHDDAILGAGRERRFR